MAKHASRRKWIWLGGALLGVLLLAFGVARWRGPVVPAYEVVSRPLVQNVVATGRVAALSRVAVGAEISGLVLERRVMEGDTVVPGDVLVVLRAADLEARRDQARAALEALRQADRPDAQARLRQAEAELAQAEREATRRRELGQQQLVSREMVEQAQQAVVAARAAAEQARVNAASLSGGAREAQLVEQLRAAEAELERAVIRATVAGTVLLRQVEPGDVVTPGQVLLELAREAPGELLLPLDEKNLSRLQVGQGAVCEADAWPGRSFNATVHHIAPSVDPARGTVDVRLRIDPSVDFLREDMTVTATILTGEKPQALVLPNDALIDDDIGRDAGQVLRVRGGKVESVPVRLGLRGLAMTEVVDGLAAGDVVLAGGSTAPGQRPEPGTRVRTRAQPLPTAAVEAPRKDEAVPAAARN